MTALAPPAALALAVRLLEAHGFAVSARNERGDSVYLMKPLDVAEGSTPHAPSPQGGREPFEMPSEPIVAGGAPLAIRISNHARTSKQRRNHPDVATSLVIRTPRTSSQIAQMVEEALRNFDGAQVRQAAAPP